MRTRRYTETGAVLNRAGATCAVLLTLLTAQPARAQSDAPSELAAGLSILDLRDEGDRWSMPLGWFLSFANPIGGSPLAVVVEGSGNYGWSDGGISVHSAVAGVRFTTSRRQRPVAYVQGLGGIMAVQSEGLGLFMIFEPGAGLELPTGRRTKIRLGATFPTVFVDGGSTTVMRIQVGMIVRGR